MIIDPAPIPQSSESPGATKDGNLSCRPICSNSVPLPSLFPLFLEGLGGAGGRWSNFFVPFSRVRGGLPLLGGTGGPLQWQGKLLGTGFGLKIAK